jgi:hypothetical protein
LAALGTHLAQTPRKEITAAILKQAVSVVVVVVAALALLVHQSSTAAQEQRVALEPHPQ